MPTATLSRQMIAASTTSIRCTGSGMKLTPMPTPNAAVMECRFSDHSASIGEPLAEHAQIPLVAPCVDQLREMFDESSRHRRATLAVGALHS